MFLTARPTAIRVGVLLLLALSSLALAGCARKADPNLALSCQVQRCVCSAERSPVFAPSRDAEVLWKDNGDAYCKPGYVLRRQDG